MSKNIAPEPLVNEAAEALELFRSSWKQTKTAFLDFGRACCWIEDRELHKYIPKEGSRKGYISFDEFVDLETGGDCSRTTIFEAKRAFKLTLGPDPIPVETLAKMPRKNMLRVAKALQTEMPAKTREKLIASATTESVNDFAVTAQKAINEQLPVEEQKSPLVSLHLMLDPRAAEQLKNLIEDFKLTEIVRDGFKELDMTSKAVFGICAAARSWTQEMLAAAKDKVKRDSPTLPDQTQEAVSAVDETAEADAAEAIPDEYLPDEFVAPDFAEAVATAETEHRVVKQKSEARH
jgi:hypothetical protein